MTDLRKDLRALLAESFHLKPVTVAELQASADGSRKLLLRLADGRATESVLIPERDHWTVCVSSQVGCAQGCRFCRTGQLGLVRNLTAGEILGQVLAARRQLGGAGRLTNVVFMGMGEPLANYANLVQALGILCDAVCGMQFASRRVTVSTVGLAPRIEQLGRDSRANLAVSLNATDEATRDRLMPVNRTYPIARLLEACRRFPLPKGRKITFEYVLLAGVNDSDADARRLVKLLVPLRAKVNLIPFNEHPAAAFRRPSQQRIDAFQQVLLQGHLTCIVRYSKGADIDAACGQLYGRKVDPSGSLSQPDR